MKAGGFIKRKKGETQDEVLSNDYHYSSTYHYVITSEDPMRELQTHTYNQLIFL